VYAGNAVQLKRQTASPSCLRCVHLLLLLLLLLRLLQLLLARLQQLQQRQEEWFVSTTEQVLEVHCWCLWVLPMLCCQVGMQQLLQPKCLQDQLLSLVWHQQQCWHLLHHPRCLVGPHGTATQLCLYMHQ
jgi:hypothetical protein